MTAADDSSRSIELSQLDASFEELYERAPCGHISMTSDGTIVRVNSTFLEWTGYSAAQLVGTPFGELLTRGSRIFAETRYLPVLRLEGAVREVSLAMRRADGSALATLVNSVVVADANGGDGLIRSAVFDATARQDYERDLLAARRQAEASEERVRVLQQASTAFLASTSESSLAQAVVESMRDAFSATAAVLLADGSGGLALVAGTIPAEVTRPAHDPEESPEREAMRTGDVVILPDLAEVRRRHPSFAAAMKSARLEAMTATRLSVDAAASGVVLCFFGRARSFDADAIGLHEALARQASEALARVRLRRRLEQMALFDQLTGLANRQLLKVRLSEVLASAHRKGHPTAVIFLDLDGFKPVNDRMGHAAGDAVLRDVADRLRSTIRADDVAGRFGGDEFVVICADADLASASAIADRLRSVIGDPMEGIPAEFAVSASIGVAVYSPTGQPPVSPDRLFDEADTAMYESKRAGKNTTTAVVVS
ncbi:MAG: diguanylate cyclase [Leifsonia sp.]